MFDTFVSLSLCCIGCMLWEINPGAAINGKNTEVVVCMFCFAATLITLFKPEELTVSTDALRKPTFMSLNYNMEKI